MKRILGAALLYPLCFSVSCSNTSGSSGPNSPNNNGGDNGGTGSTGAGSNAGAATYNASQGGSTSNGTGVPDLDSGCASDAVSAALTRVNIVFLLDKSGSMGDDPNNQWANAATRWNPVVTTLRSFFQDQASTGIYASLSFLPADGNIGPACNVANYETGTSSIKVPMTLLNTAGQQLFLSKLCDPTVVPQPAGCIVPAGGTPTRPALQGTIDYAATVQQKNPGSKTVIVFLTDGEPGFGYSFEGQVKGLYTCDDLPPLASDGNTPSCNCDCCAAGCSPASLCKCGTASCGCVEDSTLCTTADAEVLRVRDVIATAPANSIYLFGVGDLTTSTMDTWAAATGNPAVALQGMSGSQAASTLATALANIRSTYLNCNIPIPPPKNGLAADYRKVNVNYINGQGVATQIGQSPGCGSTKMSWQYDNPASPTLIELCPNACNMAQQDPNGQIQVVLGCATVVN